MERDDDANAPEPLPSAPPPRGWRRVRIPRPRTFGEDYPTFGDKLRFFVGMFFYVVAAVSFLPMIVIGHPRTDTDFVIFFVSMGAGLVLLFIGKAIGPFAPVQERQAFLDPMTKKSGQPAGGVGTQDGARKSDDTLPS
jgi:hypothetical protein